jgi:hypothetical protein
MKGERENTRKLKHGKEDKDRRTQRERGKQSSRNKIYKDKG